ncbi:hypothetical protein ACLOJK_023137 [Asimina triloba]
MAYQKQASPSSVVVRRSKAADLVHQAAQIPNPDGLKPTSRRTAANPSKFTVQAAPICPDPASGSDPQAAWRPHQQAADPFTCLARSHLHPLGSDHCTSVPHRPSSASPSSNSRNPTATSITSISRAPQLTSSSFNPLEHLMATSSAPKSHQLANKNQIRRTNVVRDPRKEWPT